MIRWSVLQLASRSSVKRVPLKTTIQLPSYLSSIRTFSVSHNNELHKPDSGSNVAGSHSNLPKIIAGGLTLGSVVLMAYYNGILDSYIGKEQKNSGEYAIQIDDKNIQSKLEEITHPQVSISSKTIDGSSLQDSDISTSIVDHTNEDIEAHSETNLPDDSISTEQDKNIQVEDSVAPSEHINIVIDNDLSNDPPGRSPSDDATSKPVDVSFDLKTQDVNSDDQQNKAMDITSTSTLAEENPTEIVLKSVPKKPISYNDIQEVVLEDKTKKTSSLLDDYFLGDNTEEFTTNSSKGRKNIGSTIEDAYEGYILKDGILVIDFLQAIHAAEKRQAELDAHSFALEKRAMKDKYEKELKDARARELMYAEREDILDKELNKERAKAAATLKSLQEKFEEKLKSELEEKDTEAEMKVKKIHDIAKAELAAAIASEKASQIEKMAEANLHINALCMAFYARSEEARHSHSVQKLALGALALEDALSKGLPIQNDIETLHIYLEGVDNDSLIASVFSSLPEDIQRNGTDTLLQLNQKFDSLKGTLRHFSLIPPGGSGILTHSLAHIASWLKVKEVDHSGDGIESLINRIENLLAQGKLCEAADALESGVKNSQAADIVDDWVRRARNRAITEQALTVLQSYATAMSVT